MEKIITKITKINQCPKGKEVFKIPLEQVRLRTDAGAFHRSDWQDIPELARQIAVEGQSTAGVVWRVEDESGTVFFEVVSGERRFKAIQVANEKHNAGILFFLASNAPLSRDGKKLTDNQVKYLNLHQNSGKDFTQLEKGFIFKGMKADGETISNMAERSGMSSQWVRECIAFAEASPAIQKKVTDGAMSYSAGKKLAKKSKKVQADTLLKSDLNPETKIKVKDIEEEEPKSQLPDTEVKQIENYENMVNGYRGHGWITREEAVKQNCMGARNLEVTIRRFTPPALTVLLK